MNGTALEGRNGKHIRRNRKKLMQWKLESMMVLLKKWSGKKKRTISYG